MQCQVAIKRVYLLGILGVLLLVAILLYFSFNPEQGLLFPKCPFNEYLGIYCSGCGTQRAIHDLLHFRFVEAMSHNFLLLPAFLAIIHHFLVKWKVIKGKSLLSYRYAPLIVLAIVLIFMLLRNLPIAPFTHLAP